MDKLKRFIDIFVPTETCNLRCGYCYITQNRKFNGKLFEFDYSIDDLKKAFSKERLGGVCLINFCAGGETLLSPSMKNIMRQKLKDNNKEYSSFRKILISKSVRRKNGKEFKNYTYKLIKKLKNDKAPFVDIVEARQEIKNYNNKIPKKYYWIFNTVFNKISLNEGMNIKIRALNMKNHKAQGEEIWLVGALVDNNWYNANELIRGKWLSRNNSIGWRNYDLLKPISNSVDMLVPYSNKLVLVFEKNKWRGVCEIEFNGKIIKKDCYSKKDDELMFVKIK